MLIPYRNTLDWISQRQNEMESLLASWVDINSHSKNFEGLSKMLNALKSAYSLLNGEMDQVSIPAMRSVNREGEFISVPLGDCLSIKKRPYAPIQIFLCGHMDTVYPSTSKFQKSVKSNPTTLQGPGTTDMKGGLVILLYALKALELSPFAENLGWSILINSDEELGSPGSRELIKRYSKGCQLGLIYEPSYPDGSYVSSRKGSVNYTAIAKGKSAHAGRDFHSGKNAIVTLANWVAEADRRINTGLDITLNIGQFEGGTAANIVPDLAIAKLNLRAFEANSLKQGKLTLEELAKKEPDIILHEDSSSPTKPFDEKQQKLFRALEQCCHKLGFKMESKPSGGTCDGARLYENGVPNIDTMGAVGGNIHTHDEFIHLPSLTQRAQISALFLMMLSNKKLVVHE